MKHPMFAQSEEDLKDHPLTEAFRQLREEDKSPMELCQMYKEEGNEFMNKITYHNNTYSKKELKKIIKVSNNELTSDPNVVYKPVITSPEDKIKLEKEYKKNMNEAYDRYSYAITLIQQAKVARIQCQENEKDKQINLNEIHAILLSNRAQASFNIKNYRYCINDCIQAIKFNPLYIKAYYKYAKALQMLKKHKSCVEICKQGLNMDSKNSELPTIMKYSIDEINKLNQLIAQKEMTLLEGYLRWEIVWIIIHDKLGGKLGYPIASSNPPTYLQLKYTPRVNVDPSTGTGVDIYSLTSHKINESNISIKWKESYGRDLSNTSRYIRKINIKHIQIPMMLLYPQYGEYDLIEAASCGDLLVEHLAVVLPEPDDISTHQYAPWDRRKEYILSNLVVYLPLNISPSIETFDDWKICYHEISCMEGQALLPSQLEILSKKYNEGLIEAPKETLLHADTPEDQEKIEEFANKVKESYNCRIQAFNQSISAIGKAEILEVHLGCSIQTILQAPGNCLRGGLMNLLVFCKDNDAHRQYLSIQKNLGSVFRILDPTGKVSS